MARRRVTSIDAKNVGIKLEPSDIARLKRLAAARGKSQSSTVAEALKLFEAALRHKAKGGDVVFIGENGRKQLEVRELMRWAYLA